MRGGGHTRGVKLSLAQWREARTLYEDGTTIDRIAKRYGCAYSTAWHAIRRNAPPREVKEPQLGLMHGSGDRKSRRVSGIGKES